MTNSIFRILCLVTTFSVITACSIPYAPVVDEPEATNDGGTSSSDGDEPRRKRHHRLKDEDES